MRRCFEGLEFSKQSTGPVKSLNGTASTVDIQRGAKFGQSTSLFSSTFKCFRKAKAGISITNGAVPILAPTDKEENVSKHLF